MSKAQRMGKYLAVWLLAAMIVQPMVSAATIYLKGEAKPIYGTLVKQGENSLLVRTATAEGKPGKEMTIARADIEELFLPIDSTRLESLTPRLPQAYRLYAEELAQHRNDPEAMAMAIELFLRAASLEKGSGQESALRGLIAAARSSGEKRRFAATAIAVCDTLPLNILGEVGAADDAAPVISGSSTRYLDFVHAVRHGRVIGTTAHGQATLESFPQFLLPAGFTLEQLTIASKKGKPTGKVLRDILLLESKLLQEQQSPTGRGEGASTIGFASTTWEKDAKAPHRFLPLPESLQDLTTSDLLGTVYREGKWVRP